MTWYDMDMFSGNVLRRVYHHAFLIKKLGNRVFLGTITSNCPIVAELNSSVRNNGGKKTGRGKVI
jgi:hypothetical protein